MKVPSLAHTLWSFEQSLEEWVTGMWTPGKIQDLRGKVAIVTGGSSGLGLEIVRRLAINGAKTYMVARTREGGEPALASVRQQLKMQASGQGEELAKSAGLQGVAAGAVPNSGAGGADGSPATTHAPGSVHLLVADLSSMSNVKELVSEIKARERGIDVLVCNASPFLQGEKALAPNHTVDGMEETLQVGYVAHAALALGLLPLMRPGGRMVLQASIAEMYCQGTEVDDVRGLRFKDSGMRAYSASKAYLLNFGDELQRRLRGEGRDVDVFAVHPGLSDTPLIDKTRKLVNPSAIYVSINNFIMGMPAWRGAYPALYAATAPALHGEGFKYIGPNTFNFFMLGMRTPGNMIWRRGGIQARRALFDNTVKLLGECGLSISHVPKAVV